MLTNARKFEIQDFPAPGDNQTKLTLIILFLFNPNW
ncbi:hypothetical protein M233_09945 [Xylella fastidiosa subsp. multiplex Griffin-1]|nr:hypothetical protein M233_09945 [Xylella fastidiosa subsp. multiplex Griffin-1]